MVTEDIPRNKEGVNVPILAHRHLVKLYFVKNCRVAVGFDLSVKTWAFSKNFTPTVY